MILITTHLLFYLLISQNFLGISSSSSESGRNPEDGKRSNKGKTKASDYVSIQPPYTRNPEAEDFWNMGNYTSGGPIRTREPSNYYFTPSHQPVQTPIHDPAGGSREPPYILDNVNLPSIRTRSNPAGDTLKVPYVLNASNVSDGIQPKRSAYNKFSSQSKKGKRQDTPRFSPLNHGILGDSVERQKSKTLGARENKGVQNIMNIDDPTEFKTIVKTVTGVHRRGPSFRPLALIVEEQPKKSRNNEKESESSTAHTQRPRGGSSLSRRPSPSNSSDQNRVKGIWDDFPSFEPNFIDFPSPYGQGGRPHHP